MSSRPTRQPGKVIYGNLVLERGHCKACDETALIIEGLLQCCLAPAKEKAARSKKWSSECGANFIRKQPSRDFKEAQLKHQDNRCLYCGLRFGEATAKLSGGSLTILAVAWDHVIPFAWCGNNMDRNFVAACQICNGLKSSKIFDSIEEIREYILKKREAKGWWDYRGMPDMQNHIHQEEEQSAILRVNLQMADVGCPESETAQK